MMQLRSILFMCGLAAVAAADTVAQVAVGNTDFYTVLTGTNAVTQVRPIIDNEVRKTGTGTLTLQNPRMMRAELQVVAGGVAISLTNAFVPPGLPTVLQQKVSFWVDANTNVVADGDGKVSAWLDAREASTNGPYRYMMATNAEAARQPLLVSDAGLGGKKYLDFGVWGNQDTNLNSRWLFWASSNGVAKTLSLRSVFIVFGSHNGGGGGGICLLQNSTSLAAPSAPFAGASDRLWLNNDNVLADDGINCLDRQMRDGRFLQIFDKAYHLIENFPLQGASANTFAKDRTYPGYSGGSRICEALVFTDEVTDAERLQVQDYLWHKWFSRSGESSVGTYSLANASTLDFALGTNDAQVVAVAGDGSVSKSGTGTLVLQNNGTDAFGGTVRLREGGLLVAGEPFLFELEGGGQSLFAQDVNVNRTDGGPAGEVLKTGSGELAVASVAAAVTKIEVAGGTLRMATPRVVIAAAMADGAVNEWSLEAFTNGLGSADTWVNYTPAPSGAQTATVNGWRFDRSAYSSGGFLIGVAFDYPRSGYVIDPGLAPDGHAVLYINRGKVETDFTVPASGVYRLEFQAAARNGNLYRHVVVLLDGSPVRTISTVTTVFWKFEIVLPYLAAGSHTIGFKGEGADNTRASFIDAIRVVPVTLSSVAPVLAAVTNASFEEPVEMFEAAAATNAPAGTGWTYGGLAGVGRIQSINSSPRSMPLALPEGIATAFLPNTNSIRQTVTFPTSGVYRLTFAVAARAGLVNHKFNVLFDGKLVRPFQTTDTAFQRVALTLPPVSTGAQFELAFEGTGAANTASLIDDVRIERIGADDSVDALKNGGFESVTTASPLVTTNWVCTSLAGAVTNNNIWGETVPYGTYMGYVSMDNAFSQTVTFAESGNYALRFITKTRAAYALPQYHDFEVTLNGVRVGRVLNMGDALRTYVLPLPPVTAGVPYVLRFKGLQTYVGYTLSMYDEIAIVPLQTRARKSVAGRFPETTALDLASDAKLTLDFEGQIKVKDVRYAGHVVAGTINAATHPEFVSGTGSILSPAKGTLITVQ